MAERQRAEEALRAAHASWNCGRNELQVKANDGLQRGKSAARRRAEESLARRTSARSNSELEHFATLPHDLQEPLRKIRLWDRLKLKCSQDLNEQGALRGTHALQPCGCRR
jgi:light-regulated signal transduction histidine kinase (bacteriophytochrome)